MCSLKIIGTKAGGLSGWHRDQILARECSCHLNMYLDSSQSKEKKDRRTITIPDADW